MAVLVETAERVPYWTVRLHTDNRHYAWRFADEEEAYRIMQAAEDYLHAIGEDVQGLRMIRSYKIHMKEVR